MSNPVTLGETPESTITIVGPHQKPLTLRRLTARNSHAVNKAERTQSCLVHLMTNPDILVSELVTEEGPVSVKKFKEFFEQTTVQDALFKHFINQRKSTILFNRLGWKITTYIYDITNEKMRAYVIFGDPFIINDIPEELMYLKQ